MSLLQSLNIIPLLGVIIPLYIAHDNGVFRQPQFNHLIDLFLKLTTSSMLGIGFILFNKSLTMETPFFRTFRGNATSDFVGSVCNKNATNSSLPSSMFEEIRNENIGGIYENFGHSCLWLLVYACCLFVEYLWRREHADAIRELISLATSVILPNEDREERKEAIVQRMVKRIIRLESRHFKLIDKELWLLVMGSICLMFIQPTYSFPSGQYFAVQLNESEWTVPDCEQRAMSQDLHILKKCEFASWHCAFKSISIIPIDHTFFYLPFGLYYCSATLALVCLFRALYKLYKGRGMDPRKMDNMLVVDLLKINVDYNKHREIIDALERKLDGRGTRTDAIRPEPEAVYYRASDFPVISIYSLD